MNRSAFLGPILILLGVFLFLKGDVSFTSGSMFAYFWPTLFVIPIGVFFHWMYFFILQRRGSGVLVPGGILLTAGIVCQISTLFDIWSLMWPGFMLAVAIGLFELYWFGGRNRYLLIPINILAVMSLLFFAVFSIGSLFSALFHNNSIIAIGLIVVGGIMMMMRNRG
ncbi:hypothetical protein A8709_02360 [Paenibacillus pectinilyticus]|uniref:DUF5668 domain-containing protein n=1 Tax=Paenibacillus pectinilyticus TaxID=512399 RepID=A0A1C1A7F0_9BACL|nr:hypothetical protein [Paenibacillus pectinilyticus]OCT16493.1 hypothetical protein A8709_02360 [Paenibacillus pectinilyticus]